MMDYSKKLTIARRLNAMPDIQSSVESDRGRIISSPAFRRLQNRTQVFPLELNAAIRSRLTHSLEVGQTARYIAQMIIKKLKKSNELENVKLNGLEDAFVSTVEMASLLHDIGNPPFGHFAEMAMNRWMNENASDILEALYPDLTPESQMFKEMLFKDLSDFDGNAQAIRVVDKLQRLNLSYSQIASTLKYTRGAFETKPSKDDPFSYLKKKPGFYYSEIGVVNEIKEALDVKDGCRFPMTYIMEASDDISYLTADLEDAVDKGILTLTEIYTLISEESKTVNEKYGTDECYLVDLVQYSYEKAQKDDAPYQFNLFLTLLRATLISDLVDHVSNVFIENHQEIFDGTFNHALLEYNCQHKYEIALEVLRNISVKYIYESPEVETLQLQTYKVINSLFDIYKPVLELSQDDMLKLTKNEKIENLIGMQLFRRLPTKHVATYIKSVEDIEVESEKLSLLEWYHRGRLLIDYISGMTDGFALKEFQTLSAMDI